MSRIAKCLVERIESIEEEHPRARPTRRISADRSEDKRYSEMQGEPSMTDDHDSGEPVDFSGACGGSSFGARCLGVDCGLEQLGGSRDRL